MLNNKHITKFIANALLVFAIANVAQARVANDATPTIGEQEGIVTDNGLRTQVSCFPPGPPYK